MTGTRSRHRLSAAALCAAAVVTLAGCAAPAGPDVRTRDVAAASATQPDDSTAAVPAPSPSRTPHPGLADFRASRGDREVAPPVSLAIPEIGVSSGLELLGRAGDGTVDVPRDPASVGWWTGGARPGQDGPAVLLGHVDTSEGPAVFYRLHELERGDELVVERADGTRATFTVTRTEQHPKQDFPTDRVYYPTLQPELRLVTCGGTIDPGTGHYRDNVIVFANQAV